MNTDAPLTSLAAYSQCIAEICQRDSITHSTVMVWSESTYTGTAEGELFFQNGRRLRLREDLDFDAAQITSYGYEVYQGEERLYWYDDFPHPNDPTLASSFPHHKHVPPDIKHHRIPAPELSFFMPNLPFLIEEIEDLAD